MWLNVVTACSSCNHRKDDWLAEGCGPVVADRSVGAVAGDLVARRLSARQLAV